jgi:hypothetical protein
MKYTNLIGSPLEQLNTKMLKHRVRNDDLGDCFPNDKLEFAIAVGMAVTFLCVGAALAWLLK